MVGVKDAHQESLVGQAGEIEPVYERYAVTFFILANGKLHFPQIAEAGAPAPTLSQQRQDGYVPWSSLLTDRRSGSSVEQRTLSTVVGDQKHAGGCSTASWCDAVERACGLAARCRSRPVKPSGFVRHKPHGEPAQALLLSALRYLPAERRLEANTSSGPVFITPPNTFGLYGNRTAWTTQTATWPSILSRRSL